MPQNDPWAQFPAVSQAGASGPVYGAPPKPEKPDAPKTTYRPLSPAETASAGLPAGGVYQVNSEGKIDAVVTPKADAVGGQLDPKTVDGQRNIAAGLLKSAGIDFAKNVDPVRDLISGSTSGKLQKFGADMYGAVTGDATDGMEKIARLATIGNDMVLQMSGGSLGAQISNSDREFIAARMGDIANPEKTDDERLAAWDQVKTRLAAISGIDVPPADPNSAYGEDGSYLGLTGTVTDDSPAIPGAGGSPPPNGPGGGVDPNGLGGLLELGKQGITLGLSDEASGIGAAIGASLFGNDPMAAYQQERDASRDTIAKAREAWPIAGTAMELLGGGGATKIAQGANSLGQIVRQGAGMGGIAGFGYGEGGDSVPNAMLGAATGGAVGGALYGVGRGVNALARPRGNADMDVIAAGQRQNIPVRQADARPELRGKYAASESTKHAGPDIRAAREADAAAMETRVAEVGGQGNPSDPYALGSQVQGAGKRYIDRTGSKVNPATGRKGIAGQMYDRATKLSGGKAVDAADARAALDANIAELRASGEKSNKGQIAYLEDLRDDFSKPLTVQGMQNLRTNMRGQISERGLTGTDAERRVAGILDAANTDLTRELPQAASAALRKADGFYKERQTFINDTLKQFMGSRGAPLSAETASSRLISMAQGKGNFEKFSGMWNKLEPDEQADVAATVASTLGRAANGKDFSPAILIKNLDPAKGINPRTAEMIFGKDGVRALQDLRILAVAKRDAMGRVAPSGQAIAGQTGGLKSVLMTALGFSQGGMIGAVAVPMAGGFIAKMGEQRAARMLLNPDFTKWLRNAPAATNPKAIDRYFAKLGTMTSIAANDNAAFVTALRGSLARGTGAAKAEEEQNAGQPPPQK